MQTKRRNKDIGSNFDFNNFHITNVKMRVIRMIMIVVAVEISLLFIVWIVFKILRHKGVVI